MTTTDKVSIKCVMFDFVGPLAHFDVGAHWSFFRRYATARTQEAEAFFSNIYNPDLIALEIGEITISEYYLRIKELLGLKISMPELVSFLRNQFYLDQQMVRVVRDLKAQGVEVVLVSNINEVHEDAIRDRFPHFFELFGYTMFSHQCGYRKPDERMWRIPMRDLGVDPDQCVYVDDMQHHVATFESIGGRGYHYDIWTESYSLDRSRIVQHQIGFINMLENLGVFED